MTLFEVNLLIRTEKLSRSSEVSPIGGASSLWLETSLEEVRIKCGMEDRKSDG